MKDQILKLAGVKTEKEFYKKYPTEEAFMKVHGKAFKKAAMGTSMVKDQLQQLTDFGNPPKAQGGLNAMRAMSNVPTINPYDPRMMNRTAGTALTGNLPKITGLSEFDKGYQGVGSSMFAPMKSVEKLPFSGGAGKGLGPASSYIQPAMDLIEGFGMIGQQNDALKEAEQNAKLTGVQAQAAALRPEPINRKYVRPEDTIIQPGQMFPNYGVGTNILAAEDGATIGGNPGEIQNTYDPYNLYDDLGYEPLNDTAQLKQYQLGGDIGQGGFGDFMNEGGSDLLNNLTNLTYGKRGPSAGNKIGKGLGTAAGTAFFGPVGGMVGGALGSVVGGLFDNTGEKLDAFESQTGSNMNSVIGQKFGKGFQQQFGLKDGGYVSNDWTPQLITKFGEYDVEDLLKPPHDADMLRAGGNIRGGYTPPSQRALQTYAMGGDLQVHRGEAETMSYNPYLPDGGETIMFRGPSHDNGGMPIEYGSSPVEVEGGEPAVKLKDGTSGDSSLVVYGNLVNPKTGKKFKRDAAEISKNEAKENKKIDKASTGLDNLNVNTSFDKLGLDTYNAILTGANMKLKKYAEDKMDLAAMQSAINDTAEEYSLIADDLAKGKVKFDTSKDATAKYGASLPKAQDGIVAKKFAATKAETEAALKALYPGKKVELKYGSEDRPISGGDKKASQRGLKGSGASRTDVSIHNLGGAKDFLIYIDGKLINDANVYKKTLHPAAQKQGLFSIGDWDPGHIGVVKEGVGSPYSSAIKQYPELKNSKTYKDTLSYLEKQVANKQASPSELRAYSQLTGKSTKGTSAYSPDYANIAKQENAPGLEWQDVPPTLGPLQTLPMKRVEIDKMKVPDFSGVSKTKPENPKFPWMDIINQQINQRRPSDAEALDASQLTPELFALTNNQLEPVQAQTYQPQLSTPYDISYQDILNANQSDFNAMQRQMGYNPEAQSALAAQKYAANEKVLGEQFRANQAEKQRVYEGNRNVLNDAQLRNLATLDQQYTRQEQAKSNTKATTLEALKSITDKYAQNKLSNRTLATYENLYNYRYDPNFRAQNMNPLAKFNIPTVTNNIPIYDNDGNIVGYQKPDGGAPSPATPPYVAPGSRKTEEKPKSAVSRNGSIVKALKNL